MSGMANVAPTGVLSGGCLVCSGLLPWVRSGPGSSLRGMELAAALRSGAGLPEWAPRAAIAIILVAIIGLLHLATAASIRDAARRVRLVSGLLVLVGLAWVAQRYPADRWGAGLVLAAIGAAIASVSGLYHEVRLKFVPVRLGVHQGGR